MVLKKSSFSRSILTLLTGTTFAQILPILASPLLTRLYTPEEFGELGIFIAILGIFSVLACLKYDLAIALPKNDKEAVNILALSMIIASIFSIFLFCIAIIFSISPYINYFPSNYVIMLWLLPIAILLTGIFQALLNWSIRKGEFKSIAGTQFYRSTVIVTGQISGGTLVNSSLPLLISQVIGQFIAVLRIGYPFLKALKKYKNHITINNMKNQLVRYKNFPIFYSGSALLNTASVQLPLFLLAFFYNPVIVGYYTLANRVLAAPISMVGSAIAQPYLQKASEKHRENLLGEFSLQIFKILLSIGLVPLSVIAIIAPELFSIVFGETWIKAGIYVQLISFWLLFVFISSPLSNIFTILELQKESLIFNLLLFLSRALVLIIGGLTKNDFFTIALFGATGAIVWFLQISWLLKQAGIKTSVTLSVLSKEVFKGIPFILILISAKLLFDNIFILFGCSLFILVIFFFIKFRNRFSNLAI